MARPPMLGPDTRGRPPSTVSRPRKPPVTRRASSNAQAPHRGEVFSVDDAIREVEADAAGRTHSYSTTLRRRTLVPPSQARVQSSREQSEAGDASLPRTPVAAHGDTIHEDAESRVETSEEEDARHRDGIDVQPEDEADEAGDGDGEDDDGTISEAESFTLKDRQQAINETHPFGIRLWKPALYKKDRSVQKNAEGDIHSSPGGHVSNWLVFFNIIWTLAVGWWMALIAFAGALVCLVFAATPGGRDYGRILWGLARYLFYPFGKLVRLEQQDDYIEEDQGEGRSISEYEQWQSGDLEYGRLFFGPERNRSIVGRSRQSINSGPDETQSLLGRTRRSRSAHGSGSGSERNMPRLKRRLFGRGQWNLGRVIFFLFFYVLLTPSLLLVSALCWFLVFSIPMGKVTFLLFDHLRRHPLALSFESDITNVRAAEAPHSAIIVCTYRAVGLKYWKYTIDGTNVFLINLMVIVGFIILDYIVLKEILGLHMFITSSAFLFLGGLVSIIPLAYFIGQAVASISAQSSMGLGAAVNAFFSTIVEVFLYCVALNQGKAPLVEGSIVGSIFAGILFLPGLSMCFGALKRKTQRFNSRSAGVTSTMLLFAVIGAFSPTLFYQIYGTHELHCDECIKTSQISLSNRASDDDSRLRDCRRCYFSQAPAAVSDRFYVEAVRPYCYLAAGMLFLSYVIGLWFTLRTHAAVIWNSEVDEKRLDEHFSSLHHAARTSSTVAATGAEVPGTADIRDSHLYKRILGQSLRQVGLPARPDDAQTRASSVAPSGHGATTTGGGAPLHVVPPKSAEPHAGATIRSAMHIPGFTEAENNDLVQHVTEIAATAATVAARDTSSRFLPRRTSTHGTAAPAAAAPVAVHTGLGLATTPTVPHASGSISGGHRPPPIRTATFADHDDGGTATGVGGDSGHDAPNWSRLKSSIILMSATVLYAIIAEILVDSVDVVLDGFAIDEKFLGITLFALVPNTTEFLVSMTHSFLCLSIN